MPSHPNGKIRGFRIRYQKLRNLVDAAINSKNAPQFIEKNYSISLQNHDRTYIIDGLSPYSEYVFQVQELTVAWGPYSDPVKNSTMQGSKYLSYFVYVLNVSSHLAIIYHLDM